MQLLLTNFGIVSRIYHRRAARRHAMPDGKGGPGSMRSRPYELVLGKANRDRFIELIGFAHSAKQAKAEAFIAANPALEPRDVHRYRAPSRRRGRLTSTTWRSPRRTA